MITNSSEKMWVRSEEIRQFVYCKRIPYFRKYMNYKPKMTIKMEEGKRLHEKVTVNQIIEKKKKNYFKLLLEDDREKLIAKIDKLEIFQDEKMVERNEEKLKNKTMKKRKNENSDKLEGRIVEFKAGIRKKRIEEHHRAQLIIQAIVAEKALNIKIKSIAVEKTDGTKLIEEELTWEARSWAMAKVTNIRKIMVKEIIPEPTSHIGKCQDCEYWKVCLRA